MTKKRLAILVVALMAVAVVGLVGVSSIPDNRPGVTKGSFDKIPDTASIEDVEKLFGHGTNCCIIATAGGLSQDYQFEYCWIGSSGYAHMNFTNNETKIFKFWRPFSLRERLEKLFSK